MSDSHLPPYRHDPGRTPHPTRDPRGHSYGVPAPPAEAFDPAHGADAPAFRRGIALFDAGYFWEAHEAWEAPWRATPRGAPGRVLLQGLIQVAAAMLKRRAGRHGVARRLAARGVAKLERCAVECGATAGIDVPRFVAAVHAACARPDAPAPKISRAR